MDMLLFLLMSCVKPDHIVDTGASDSVISDASDEINTSKFDRYVQQFQRHVTHTDEIDVMIPMGEEIYPVTVNFHMSDTTVENDINHLVMSSDQVLNDAVPKFAEKIRQFHKITPENCIEPIRSIELYHVPCLALNDDISLSYFKEDYPDTPVGIILGITVRDHNEDDTYTFAVGYCYDEMVNVSDLFSYERDSQFREAALAHEMAHVWLESCMTGASFFYPEEFESVASRFHEGYEDFVMENGLHVDYGL